MYATERNWLSAISTAVLLACISAVGLIFPTTSVSDSNQIPISKHLLDTEPSKQEIRAYLAWKEWWKEYQAEQARLRALAEAAKNASNSGASYSANIGQCHTEPGTPPAEVLNKENPGGKSNQMNLEGSSAAGCWQIIKSTWNGYGGYESAAQAPVSVQNQKAKELWAGGRGCHHWEQTSSQC